MTVRLSERRVASCPPRLDRGPSWVSLRRLLGASSSSSRRTSSRGGVPRSSLPAPSRVLSVGRDPGSREAPDAPTRGVPKSRPLDPLTGPRTRIASAGEGPSLKLGLQALERVYLARVGQP